eukprot:scaffold16306_cov45-Attheya_sp.AAC.2
MATISASAALLSEEELLNCRLEKPIIKLGNHTYPTSKSGSIPYDPNSIEIVSLATFLDMFLPYQGGIDKIQNIMPPVDWRNAFFS